MNDNPAQAGSLPAVLTGPRRLLAPVARRVLVFRSPYCRRPGRYAEPWEAIRRTWRAAALDGSPA